MIRLDLPREPHWLDMPHGVRLHVRPLDTATDAAARAAAAADLRERGESVPPAAAKDSWRLGQAKAAANDGDATESSGSAAPTLAGAPSAVGAPSLVGEVSRFLAVRAGKQSVSVSLLNARRSI
ncbi:MAG: hypothetical protein GC191_09030 [Azospirillum sp.]|nr:hypothetical protein [Azospirillum sp.]